MVSFDIPLTIKSLKQSLHLLISSISSPFSIITTNKKLRHIFAVFIFFYFKALPASAIASKKASIVIVHLEAKSVPVFGALPPW
mgnify:CR=1 FL=1